jgi:hypothetical protein
MMIELKREDPPPVGNGGSATNWRDIFENIRTTPWEWVVVGEYPAAYVTSIKKGKFAGSQPDEFEATMRDIDAQTQKGRLYVRYVDAPKPEGHEE